MTKILQAQLDCSDMRVYPFIQESRPIVKLKLLFRPPGSKLAGLWRRLAPHGHKFPHTRGRKEGTCLCSLEGRGGEGGSVSLAQSVEGGPALWLPGPLHRTGVL